MRVILKKKMSFGPKKNTALRKQVSKKSRNKDYKYNANSTLGQRMLKLVVVKSATIGKILNIICRAYWIKLNPGFRTSVPFASSNSLTSVICRLTTAYIFKNYQNCQLVWLKLCSY